MENQLHTEKREDPVRRILDAAAVVFAESGFTGARVDEIAARAGVNKAAIYYHIGDKESLYARVLHDIFHDFAGSMAMNIKTVASPEERLKTYIRNFARTVDQHPHLAPIMMREMASGGQHFPEVVAQDIGGIIRTLTEIFQEGIGKGVFEKTAPLIVHLMIAGCLLFLKTSESVRSRHDAFPEEARKMGKNVSEVIADEIEKLILKAVKK